MALGDTMSVLQRDVPDLAGVSLNELEKQAIIDTLAKTRGNREKAAKFLGVGRATLYRFMNDYPEVLQDNQSVLMR